MKRILISAWIKDKVYPAGGDYEFTIGVDGRAVSSRAFTKSCIDLSTTAAAGATDAMVTMSHLLDPTPTEIHVFLSLWMKTPMVVITQSNHLAWSVDGATVNKLDIQ